MENLNDLTVAQLKERLLAYGKGEEALKGLLKADLVDLLTSLSSSATPEYTDLSKEELIEILKGQDKVVEELKATNEAKKDVSGKITAKHKGETFVFVVPKFTLPAFGESIPGKEYTAKEAAANPEVVAQLVKIKSGVIKLQK